MDGLFVVLTESGKRKVLALTDACPECRNGTLVKRIGKFGEFVGCSTYPSCNYTRKAPNQRR
jgi:ssDNA-binding Zn-finger/Zn-ribbon topoisomerase 1